MVARAGEADRVGFLVLSHMLPHRVRLAADARTPAPSRRNLGRKRDADASLFFAVEHLVLFSRLRFPELFFELVDTVLQRRDA
jgi:hypothetical protein